MEDVDSLIAQYIEGSITLGDVRNHLVIILAQASNTEIEAIIKRLR
jgi:hypothetical protein